MLQHALTFEAIGTPPNLLFIGQRSLQYAISARKSTNDLHCHIYVFLVQHVLKDTVGFVQERSFSFRSTFDQKIMASASGRSPFAGSESMDYNSVGSNDEDMEIYSFSICNNNLQPGRFKFTESFRNE